MPYTDPAKQRKAVREAARRFRKREKQKLEQLQKQFPDVYKLIFEKKRKTKLGK